MVTSSYETVLEMAESLTAVERGRLLEALKRGLCVQADPEPVSAEAPKKKHSIMELEGLGKEIWQGIDAKQYVRAMRDEWDG